VALGSTLTSPNLSHIGSQANIGFSLIAADDPSAPRFDVNTGEFNLIGWRTQDGMFPPIGQAIHVTADGQAVAVAAKASWLANAVTFDQALTTTPADIAVIASQGRYNDQVILFAAGTTDGLVAAPLNMTPGSISFTLHPLVLQFTADSTASPPVPMTVHVSTGVGSAVFGTILALPLNYSVDGTASFNPNAPSLPLPSWLSVTKSGTTPEDVTFTANPEGLADGLKPALVRFVGAGPAPPPGLPSLFPAALGFLSASLRLGPAPAPATPVTITLTPSTFTLRFTDPSQQQQSATVHVASTSDPVDFRVDRLPAWLTANPSTGQTPADITFTGTPPGGNGAYATAPDIDIAGARAYQIQVNVDVALPGYVGLLSVQPIANSFPPVSRGIAPGSLFYIQLNRPEAIPDETDPAGAAVFTLAGYSFAANGTPVALIAYRSGQFLAQMPVDAKPGRVAIDAFDSSGTPVATANAMIMGVAPDFVADPFKPRAQKADGTTIDANNPVAPGDTVLVQVTGLGTVNPPLATGQIGAADTPSTPVAAVTATIGGKKAQVISAQASGSSAGVADIWLTEPDLYDGDHYISVGAMGVWTSTRIPIRVKNP
jgi:uncharacterized protein (TIGR03437 family)